MEERFGSGGANTFFLFCDIVLLLRRRAFFLYFWRFFLILAQCIFGTDAFFLKLIFWRFVCVAFFGVDGAPPPPVGRAPPWPHAAEPVRRPHADAGLHPRHTGGGPRLPGQQRRPVSARSPLSCPRPKTKTPRPRMIIPHAALHRPRRTAP